VNYRIDNVKYRLENWDDPRIWQFINAIDDTHNGGVLVRHIVPYCNDYFDYTMVAEKPEEFFWERRLLESEQLPELIPELEPYKRRPLPVSFQKLDGYEVEGHFVNLLRSQGAHERSKLAVDEARRIAIGALDAMVGEQRDYLFAVKTEETWAHWFFNGPWDRTLIVHGWWLICMTDID
jgi:hypothetical protein